MKNFIFLLFTFIVLLLEFSLGSCAHKNISKHENIIYKEADTKNKTDKLQLNIFGPKEQTGPKDVFIFLHGGGWNKGKKSTYSFLGKRLAKKGIVAVIMDYPLAPEADYTDMAMATANAVKWVKENISKYGGNPERLFLSGHSAGGHLAALITVREKYFESLKLKDPVKAVILIDAAGLDMNSYLIDQEAHGGKLYLGAFTKDKNNWIEASPVYHVHERVPPMLILTAGKTYPNIKSSNERFVAELTKHNVTHTHKVFKRKRHIPMIFQLYDKNNSMYDDIISYMREQK